MSAMQMKWFEGYYDLDRVVLQFSTAIFVMASVLWHIYVHQTEYVSDVVYI